jgi:large subunit ribosomal protein L4
MRRAALRSALSVKAAEGQIVVVEVLSLEAPKASAMKQVLTALVGEATSLVLLPARDETVEKSIRNLPGAKYLRANYLNIRDLLQFEKIVLPLGALDVIQSYLG